MYAVSRYQGSSSLKKKKKKKGFFHLFPSFEHFCVYIYSCMFTHTDNLELNISSLILYNEKILKIFSLFWLILIFMKDRSV